MGITEGINRARVPFVVCRKTCSLCREALAAETPKNQGMMHLGIHEAGNSHCISSAW